MEKDEKEGIISKNVGTRWWMYLVIPVFIFFYFYSYLGFDKSPPLDANEPLIAITQISPHPSLDRIREGLVQTLEKRYPKATILIQNAQGSPSIATQIAQQFLSKHPSIVIPITTPSAQAVASVFKNSPIPIVFCAVSDPMAAKLIKKWPEPNKTITGIADRLPLKNMLAMIHEVLGKKALRLGIVYNPSEINVTSALDELEKLLHHHQGILFKAPCSNIQEISTSTRSIVDKVDAIILLNDNLVIGSVEVVLSVATKEKKPIFASDPQSVERGCLGALAPDQFEIGIQAGKMAIKVLEKKSPKEVMVEAVTHQQLYINTKIAKILGINISSDIKKTAKIIGN